MGKKQTLTNGPEGELINRERENRAASEDSPNYGPLGVDQNTIPREQYNGVERMDVLQTPVNNPVQPGSPVGVPDLASGQQRAGTPGYQLDQNYSPQTTRSGSGFKMKQTGTLGNGQIREGRASGGDPLWVATAPVATFEIDRQLSDVRKQKAELADWISKQGEQFQGKAADPYQPAYEQYVGREQNKMVKDVADTYFDGNMDKAWQGIHDDPQLRSDFMRNNRYLAAIGQANRGGYAVYEQAEKDIRDGKLELPPKDMELLNDALDGKWAFNGDTPAHSAWKFDQLNDKLSIAKKWNDYFRPSMDKAGDLMVGNNRVYKDPKSGRRFLVTDSKEDYDQFVDQFTKQAMKDGPWRNEADVKEFAESMVGRMDKETWKALPIGKSGGGSKGGAGGADSKIRLSAERASDGAVEMKIFGTTSGAPSIMRPLYFTESTPVAGRSGSGVAKNRMSAIPVSFAVDKNGDLILKAKRTKEPGTGSSNDEADTDADSAQPMTQKDFEELPSMTFRGDAVNPALEAIATDKGWKTPSGFPDVDAAREWVMTGIRERGGAPKKAKPLAKGSLDDI